jgi:segregation and condensation protein B
MTELCPESESDDKAQDQRPERLAPLEAVLFMAAEPLSASELAEILQVSPQEADDLARALDDHYAGRGLQVTRIAGGYQVCTRPEYAAFVARLHKPERFRLSRAALETLAIVAYRQPVTRPEIEGIRGVNSDSPIDTLLQYALICEAGRKDTPGRPVLYRTTQDFLGHFGLDSIEDLPQLESIPEAEADVEQPDAQDMTEDRETTAPAEPQPSGDPEQAGE